MIDSAQSQRNFISLVLRSGLTNAEDPNGGKSGGPLVPGASSTGVIGVEGGRNTHQYKTRPWRPVELTLRALSQQSLRLTVRDVRSGRRIASAVTGADGAASVSMRALSGELAIDVTAVRGAGAYEIAVAESGVDLDGTSEPDELSCDARPTHVAAGAKADVVTCGPAPDALVGGPGADRLSGGGGDDLFIARRSGLLRGTERLDGGDGDDTALFVFRRPAGVRCSHGTTSRVRLRRHARFRLRSVEKVLFAYAPCGARRLPVLHVPALGTSAPGAAPLSTPPVPRVRIVARNTTIIGIRVRVSRATAVSVGARVRVGDRRVIIPTVSQGALGPGSLRFRLVIPRGAVRSELRRGATGRLTVSAVTTGMVGGPTKLRTVTATVSG